MLPITNHRVLHVPHSLAVGAAIVGLFVALSWDRPQIAEDPAMVRGATSITIEDDRGDAVDPLASRPSRDSGSSDAHGREMLPGFGPLVLPLGPGRG